MDTAPVTPEARRAVEALLNSPVTLTEEAAAEKGVRFLLDGLEVGSIQELHALVGVARAAEPYIEEQQLRRRRHGWTGAERFGGATIAFLDAADRAWEV